MTSRVQQRSTVLVLMLLSLGSHVAYSATTPRQRGTTHRVRGLDHQNGSDDYQPYRRLMMGSSGSSSKSPMSTSKSSSKMSSSKSKSMMSSKGSGGSGSSGSGSGSGSRSKENIFDHSDDGPAVPVNCGTVEEPFLGTWLVSVRFLDDLPAAFAAPRVPMQDTANDLSTDEAMAAASGDPFFPDNTLPPPKDELTPMETTLLGQAIRESYNHLVFRECDGFFRDISTISMLPVPKLNTNERGEYSVSLQRSSTQKDDPQERRDLQASGGVSIGSRPNSGTTAPAPVAAATAGGTPTAASGSVTIGGRPNNNPAPAPTGAGWYGGAVTAPNAATPTGPSWTPAPVQAGGWPTWTPAPATGGWPTWTPAPASGSGWGSWGTNAPTVPPTPPIPVATKDVTIEGGPGLTIYLASLTATCRNCGLTEDVNFPLLLHESEQVESFVNPTTGVVTTTTTSTVVEPPLLLPGNGTDLSPAPLEEECTCPASAIMAHTNGTHSDDEDDDETEEEEEYRRKLAGHTPNLPLNPTPQAPTSEELVEAVNAYIIENLHSQGQLLRIMGLDQILEPDYFAGQSIPTGPTMAPTVSAAPSVSSSPTQAPTLSAQPTISKAPSSQPSISNQPTSSFAPSMKPSFSGQPTPTFFAPFTPWPTPSTPAPVYVPFPEPTDTPASREVSGVASRSSSSSLWIAMTALATAMLAIGC